MHFHRITAGSFLVRVQIVDANAEGIGFGAGAHGDVFPFGEDRSRAGFDVNDGVYHAGHVGQQAAFDLAGDGVRLGGGHGRINFDVHVHVGGVARAA